MFDPSERPIADDLQRQFEAISRLPDDQRAIARVLLEGARAQVRSAAVGTGAVALHTKQQQRQSKQARQWQACPFVRMAICHTSVSLAGIKAPCASTTWRRLPYVLLSCGNHT
ncbi:MAG TPA: hypothetical protein VIG88_03440 [Lysobacter sp.]